MEVPGAGRMALLKRRAWLSGSLERHAQACVCSRQELPSTVRANAVTCSLQGQATSTPDLGTMHGDPLQHQQHRFRDIPFLFEFTDLFAYSPVTGPGAPAADPLAPPLSQCLPSVGR